MENTKRENKNKKVLLLALLLLLLLLGGVTTMWLFGRPAADPVVAQNPQSSEQSVPEHTGNVNIADNETPTGNLPANLPADAEDTNGAENAQNSTNGNDVVINAPATPAAPAPTAPTVPTANNTPSLDNNGLTDIQNPTVPTTPTAPTTPNTPTTPSTPVNPTPNQEPTPNPAPTPNPKPEQPTLSNTEITMNAAQDLQERYNACTNLDEKRALLNSTGAVGNDQLRQQLLREMNEELGNEGMLKLEDEVLDQTQNQAGKDLYIQAFYPKNEDGKDFGDTVLLFASDRENLPASNENPWKTNLVYMENENNGNWYEYIKTHPYNDSIVEEFKMTDFNNKSAEEIQSELQGENWSVVPPVVENHSEPVPVNETNEEPVPVEPAA